MLGEEGTTEENKFLVMWAHPPQYGANRKARAAFGCKEPGTLFVLHKHHWRMGRPMYWVRFTKCMTLVFIYFYSSMKEWKLTIWNVLHGTHGHTSNGMLAQINKRQHLYVKMLRGPHRSLLFIGFTPLWLYGVEIWLPLFFSCVNQQILLFFCLSLSNWKE